MLRRYRNLVRRLDPGRASTLQLRGTKTRHHRELERIHAVGTFHHRDPRRVVSEPGLRFDWSGIGPSPAKALVRARTRRAEDSEKRIGSYTRSSALRRSLQLSGRYHSGDGPAARSTSGTKLRSSSLTSAPRFSTTFVHCSASPIGYCDPAIARGATGNISDALNPTPRT